jgi:hypothetical protein
MRKVIASEFVSLDGVMESPEKWHFPYFNDEMGEAICPMRLGPPCLHVPRRNGGTMPYSVPPT